MKEAFEGTIDKIIYTNEDNGYSVFTFLTPDGPITASGVISPVMTGLRCQLEGEFRNHPKYGRQFVFSWFKEIADTAAESIAAFLASGVIKGIGPAMARTIVAKFGDETVDIITNHPDRLTEVSGIGPKKAKAITEGYREHRGYADLVMSLAAYGISSGVCMKLFKAYGPDAKELILQNPYRLVREVPGFGFLKADEIALQLGLAPDSKERISCAVSFLLSVLNDNGSTFVREEPFVEELAQRLQVPRETVSDVIFDMVIDGHLVSENLAGSKVVMSRYMHETEQNAAAKLFALAHAGLPHISADGAMLIAASEKESGIQLSMQQKNAVLTALENGVSVITGGPGTGKTTIINTLLYVLEAKGVKTLLAAPTGRAAKRMTQATGRHAVTIHRLLEATVSEGDDRMFFLRCEENPLECDCVVIDEVSMVDILLMEALLDAVKPGTRLILVGDADQLPSVGPGSVLKDILESDTIHSIRLTEIFRQAQGSAIVTNAHAINRGEYPVCNEKDTDFFFMEKDRPADTLALIKELCARRLPAFYNHLDPLSDIQVLTPTKKEMLGSRNLNKELQAVLNPPSETKPELKFGDRVFRLGDKVIQIKNDYSLEWKSIKDFQFGTGIFNGDIGRVYSVDPENGRLTILYDEEKLVAYDFSNADEIDMAYALTVHKSQGCEFPVVVIPTSVFIPALTTRNLLYTAITRAKEAVVLVGRSRVCFAMVDNNSVEDRNSGLGIRLRKLWDYEYGNLL